MFYNEILNCLHCYTGDPVELSVTKQPKFCKARPVPYAMQSRVETALLQIEKEGVITKVSTLPCAAPVVPVEKKDSTVCVCGDFSTTFNACAEVISYPIPRIEDLHTALR
jgi:hypothetical protein